MLAAGLGRHLHAVPRRPVLQTCSGLPNGTYYVAVLANPENRLVESSLDNNLELREIRLSGKPGARKVTVPQVGIIEEEVYGGTG